eukprot:s1684_g5.t1
MASALKNVSSWRLNLSEKEEVKKRVDAGEDETKVTRELQAKKAQAALDRKMAAAAVADRSKQVQASQASQSKQKSVKEAKPAGKAADPEQGDACNKAYYECVQRDVALIVKEFGKSLADEAPLAIAAGGESGVQEPFDKEKGKIALRQHGVYRTRKCLDEETWKQKRDKWRCVLLSIPCAFVEASQSQFWRDAFNKRQSIQQEHESLTRTAVQHSLEIASMKTLVETQVGKKLTSSSLAQELLRLGLQPVVAGSGNKTSAPGHDDEDGGNGCLSAHFITAALNCHKWILSSSECVLEHFFDSVLPKSGMCDEDRKLLKTALGSHSEYRAHSAGTGDCTWQARLCKSGIMTFEFLEDNCAIVVYGRSHDHTLRQAAKQGTVEAVMEHENIREKWKKVEDQFSNEAVEKEALAKAAKAASDGEEEPEEVVIRKAPSSFALHSPAYWRAVANATVRTYIALTPEPRTQEAVTTAIAQGNLKGIQGNAGETSVITLLDLELLGEAQGPGCQPGLRKQFSAPAPLLSRLIYGSMVARGSQKVNDEGEAKAVVEGDLVMVHCGSRGKKEIKAMFSGSKNQRAESELKETIIVYTDESLRSRKKRVKGGYSGHSQLVTASSAPLAQVVPEKSYDFHTGSCWSDVFSGVQALGASELWYASRTVEVLTSERVVEATADAKAKADSDGDAGALESVFSGAVLPENFYRDLLRGHSAKGLLDLSVGEGTAARACLLERIPYCGFTLSEAHSKKIEVQLTDFIVSEFKKEGSTHYRPEACQSPGVDTAETDPKPKKKSKAKAKPKAEPADSQAQGKKNKKTEEDDEGEPQPKKKTKKTDEEEAASEAESLPW